VKGEKIISLPSPFPLPLLGMAFCEIFCVVAGATGRGFSNNPRFCPANQKPIAE
jgi:hypothetical protein